MDAENESAAGGPERRIFLDALERTGAEQQAFVAEACGPDEALRARVAALLRARDAVGSFLETPAVSGARAATPSLAGPSDTLVLSPVTEKAGDRIGRYKLLQKIGEGGVGVVYMAEQEEPVRRRVALKVLKVGMETKNLVARFEAERQALALMDHANIAKVLDAGATATGRLFFVMELVHGVRMTEFCDEHHLPTAERLQLFIKVCQAIQHAHQKGIIHRDIKPSNILVTLHDGIPVPKVIDFGIAKATEHRLTDKTLFTEYAMFIGTPAYMSPEQAQMSGLDIDTRSDIYSLGVLLYELLIGKTPFDAEALMRGGLDECRRTVREQEPERPSKRLATMAAAELTNTAQQRRVEVPRLLHLLSGDLDWIAMKCLEKDRTRRYETTSALAADIQHYLDGQPVSARPPSNLYRLRKFAGRHQGVIAVTAAITAALLIGVTISVWQAVRATRAEKLEAHLRQQADQHRVRAEKEKASARLNEYVADINLAKQSLDSGNYGRAVQLLEKQRPQAGEPDLRGFEWRYLWQISRGDEHLTLPNQDAPVRAVAFSPNGDLVVVGTTEKFNVYNAHTRALVTTVPKGATALAFLPAGQTLFTSSFMDREPRRPMSGPMIRVWNTADWTEQRPVPGGSGLLAISHDGTRLAAHAQGMRGRELAQGIRVWELAGTNNYRELRFLPATAGPLVFTPGPLALAPDGSTLAADSREGITLWRLDDARQKMVLQNASNLFASFGPDARFRPAGAMSFSPDGKWLVATRNSLSERGVFVLGIWNVETGEETATPADPEHHQHSGIISSLAFSPAGHLFASASMDYSIRLWNFETRQHLATLQGHLSEVWTLAFSPDGQTLVSGARDGSVKLWAVNRPAPDEVLEGPWQPPIAISKDSRRLGALRQNSIALVNLDTLEQELELPLAGASDRFGFRPAGTIALSDDLTTLAQGLDDGRVQIWNVGTRETKSLRAANRQPSLLALAPDGRLLVTGGYDRALHLWDLRDGHQTRLETEAVRVLFSPDGRTLAAFRRDNIVECWDLAALTRRTNLVSDADLRSDATAAFSPDGHLLAVACADDTVPLWDTGTGKLLGACTGHKQGIFAIAFAPDGKTLATASDDSTLKLWNVATQQELLTFRRLGGALRTLCFSPDGRVLVGRHSSVTRLAGLRFYRAPSLAEIDAAKAEASRLGKD